VTLDWWLIAQLIFLLFVAAGSIALAIAGFSQILGLFMKDC
jgi:hypothetical protein